MPLDRRVVGSTANGAEEFTLGLGVAHELVVIAADREVLEALDTWMVRPNLLVVIIEVPDVRVLRVRVRVTE